VSGVFDPRNLVTRRRTLRTAATAAAAAMGGAVLAACGSASSNTAGASSVVNGPLPVPTSGVVHLTFQPNTQGSVSWNKTTQALFQEFVDKNFNQNPNYKGIWATAQGPWGNESGQVTDDIAGTGFNDIWHFCCGDVPAAIHSGFAQPLDDLLRRDNISMSNWSKGHLTADSLAGTLYGLPSYDGTMTVIYRQDLLDQLGLAYPDPSWDSKQALQIWQACTGKNSKGQARTGVNIYYAQEDLDWWLAGWGASEMNAAQDQATMNSPQGVDCFTYIQQLFSTGVTKGENRGVQNLINEQTCFEFAHSAYVIDSAVLLGNKYKWDYLPVPTWPAGKSCMETIDCYMLNAATKNLDAAWELMKWINLGSPKGDGSYDYAWPQFQIQINLITPSLVNLWDYWQTTLQTVAPPLKGKSLQWWAEPAQKGYARPQLFYLYQYSQASGVEANWMTQIAQGKVTPALGLQQMQDQVNAIEAAGKSESQAGSNMAKLFPTTGKDVASMPAGI
jgi:ABC-type glycerol-3-phosphate transport system substrate-binding protein